MQPPRILNFLSDYSTAEYIRTVKDVWIYKYTKAIENNGKEFDMTEKRINYLISVRLIKIEE